MTVQGLGRVDSDGGLSGYLGSSGGSGGSVLITTHILEGGGTIAANGGTGSTYSTFLGGSGSGGRIAVYFDDMSSYLGAISAFGGSTDPMGGPGTIYLHNRNTSR